MIPMMRCLWNSYGCFASGLDLDLDLWIFIAAGHAYGVSTYWKEICWGRAG